MKKIKVGFDYDDTIRERRSIQLYCVELLKDPLIEPHIVTRRANRIDRVNWPYVEPIYWLEVYDLAKKLGIHYDHVHFCNFEMKGRNVLMAHEKNVKLMLKHKRHTLCIK